MNAHEFKPDAAVIGAQTAAILAALQNGPCTTSELRARTGAMCPAARVYDLKRAGFSVVTARRGRQACYALERTE